MRKRNLYCVMLWEVFGWDENKLERIYMLFIVGERRKEFIFIEVSLSLSIIRLEFFYILLINCLLIKCVIFSAYPIKCHKCHVISNNYNKNKYQLKLFAKLISNNIAHLNLWVIFDLLQSQSKLLLLIYWAC